MLSSTSGYRLAADLVLIVHASFAVFIVVGLVLILIGGARRWRWVRNPWFRWAHLAAILIVVVQTWLGTICPLTSLEMGLRRRGEQATYDETFIAHWIGELLYFDLPAWVFVVAYTAFAALVAWAWWAIRPRRLRRGASIVDPDRRSSSSS